MVSPSANGTAYINEINLSEVKLEIRCVAGCGYTVVVCN